jgi:hypothetical protein
MTELFSEFAHNFSHNLFKPLLLFFYLGFAIPLLRVSFEFPYVIYQGLTMYLLIAIGWRGGEELASLPLSTVGEAVGFMAVGALTNFCIGVVAYVILRRVTRLRKVDAATVAGYYGSDSAGTFVTCVGVLSAMGIVYQAYMPVMLAVMEIPGCLVALFLVSRLRRRGLDAQGNAWDEPGYQARPARANRAAEHAAASQYRPGGVKASAARMGNGDGYNHDEPATATAVADREDRAARADHHANGSARDDDGSAAHREVEFEAEMSLERVEGEEVPLPKANGKPTAQLLHEVFLNPGIYLLFGGILIGFVSRLQGDGVTAPDDSLFVTLFQGILCLFLLEMGITASKRLRDLKHAGWRFILFGLLAPNVFAMLGILVAHLYAMLSGAHFDLGTYVLFAVLCGAASYIAVPAVQRLAIPEASPTLPLAASLGLTFSYNVTIGIPIYILIAKAVTTQLPIVS